MSRARVTAPWFIAVFFGLAASLLILTHPYFRGETVRHLPCDAFLAQHEPGWVRLEQCFLDFDAMVLESDAGDFEAMADRKKGLSRHPYASPPHWVTAYVPLRALLGPKGAAKVAVVVQSRNLLDWVQAVDRADDVARERMVADPVVFRLMAQPRQLQAQVAPAPEGFAQQAFGTYAVTSLQLLSPGEPEKVPFSRALFAILLVMAISATFLRLTARRDRTVDEEAALATLTPSDEKVELGALEELRQEERRKGGQR